MKKSLSPTNGLILVGSFVVVLILIFAFSGKKGSSDASTIQEAEILYDMGDNIKALEFYNKELRTNPQDIDALITRGKIFVKLGRYEDAINDFYKASKLDGSQDTYLLYKGLVTMQSAVDANALAILDSALSGNTTNLDMYTFYKCGLLYQLNNVRGANVCLDELLAIDNNTPQGNFLKAMSLSKMSRWRDSIKYFDKAESGGLMNEELLLNKGIALAAAKLEGAIEYLDKALMSDINNTGALYYKAMALTTQEDYTSAVDALDKAIAVDSAQGPYYSLKGDILVWLKNYDQAIQSYDKALALNPKDSDILAKKAIAQYKKGATADMENTLEQAKIAVPYNANMYVTLSNTFIRLGKYDDAIEYADKALEINSGHNFAEFNKGLAYYLMGKPTRADERYIKLRGINTLPQEAKIVFVNYKISQGDYDTASTTLQEVLKEDPYNEMALATKVKLFIALEKLGKALWDKDFDYKTPQIVDNALTKLNKYSFLDSYK